MPDLKLIALDEEDLSVISAHLQDAVMKVGDLAFLPKERRFAAIANRFDWVDALQDAKGGPQTFARRRTALRFERVLSAKVQGIDLQRKGAVLALLAMRFQPADPPSGEVTLEFADGGAIRLAVECVEAELKDLGAVWQTKSKPRHPDEPAQGS